jgi:hypothetical protein
MFHGLAAYSRLCACAALVLHLIFRQYASVCLFGSIFASLVNLAHETSVADFQINPGWAPAVVLTELIPASPVFLIVGFPFFIYRRHREDVSLSSRNKLA